MKNNIINNLLLLLLLMATMSFASCKDDKHEMVYKSLKINSTRLFLVIGKQGTVKINSGNGYYRAQSSDANVATATVSGDTVTVTTVGYGKATITVTDRIILETATFEVTVQPKSYLTCPDNRHPHPINLGLPSGTLWACRNVYASSPEDYGGYFAWGETETKWEYSWSEYTLRNNSTFTDIGSDIAGTQYDAAHVRWGGFWVMPSKEQQDELRMNCTYTWTIKNGISGGQFTGPNGGTIFLPAAGFRCNDEPKAGDHFYVGYQGIYWSSTQIPWNEYRAFGFNFNESGQYSNDEVRYIGLPVRPVSR
jgi:hypothetical protein